MLEGSADLVLSRRANLLGRSFLEMETDSSGSRLVIVDQKGYGHFKSIQAAVSSVPVNNTRPYTILVTPGLFVEKVMIPHTKPFITLQGLGNNVTVISWHDTASTMVSNTQE
eukprot:c39605_g1_i1 orf=1-336(+)